MPAYPYVCANGHTFDRFLGMTEEHPEVTECPEGHGPARRDYATQFASQARHIFQGFVDSHLTGKPTEIRSKEQHEAMMKANNVRLQEYDEWPEHLDAGPSQYKPSKMHFTPAASSTPQTTPSPSQSETVGTS